MPTASQLTDIAHVIQLAVAPVFLLSGIGGMLAVFVIRLGRIVDRSRVMDNRLEFASADRKASIRRELTTLSRRSRLINLAIVLATAAGFFVCLLIFVLFVDYLVKLKLSVLVASLFLLAMLCLLAAFASFQREVLLATAPLRRDANK
jgi:hypothetical protein